MLGARICRWVLLFKEYDFELIANPGQLNASQGHLLHIEKAWHDGHIKMCTFKLNDLVLLYYIKFNKFPTKFGMLLRILPMEEWYCWSN